MRLEALKEVGPSVFFSLLVIAVAFLPIFALVDQEGRLFKPLAYSKNLAMALAALLAITLDPAMRMLFARMDPFTFRPRWLAWLATKALVGTYYAEEKHPISRVLFARLRAGLPLRAALPEGRDRRGDRPGRRSRVPVYFKLGTEFMPPLNEGTILYMPTTLPGISVPQAQRAARDPGPGAQVASRRSSGCSARPGRAETSTDPAPFSMMETTVVLKPEAQWGAKARWYSLVGAGLAQAASLRPIWPDRISWDELVDEMDRALRIPGVTNAWTMPIKARIDMLTTGVRTPVGIKIFGADLEEIERIGEQLEGILRDVPGTRSVFAERVTGGYFVDFEPRRDQLARYGLTDRGGAGRDHDRDRRRERHHHDRGARALPGQRPLPARAARRRRPAAARAGADARRARRCRSPSSPTSSSSRARR